MLIICTYCQVMRILYKIIVGDNEVKRIIIHIECDLFVYTKCIFVNM